MNKRISNKISKKIVAAMLVAAMGFSLTACGDDVEENKVSKTNNLTQNVEAIEVESKEIDEVVVREIRHIFNGWACCGILHFEGTSAQAVAPV